jgi:putative DNA primase/helicase
MSITFEKTRIAARGKWRGILLQAGLDESFLKNEHGPCPICQGKDRYRWDDLEGDGTFYCTQCGPGTGMKLLMTLKNWPFPQAAAWVDSILGTVQATLRKAKRNEDDTRRILTKLWTDARPVQPGDPVWLYLERRCGDPSAVLEDLRYHPALKHTVDGGNHPAMLALLRPNEGKATGIHRTFLTPDGRKAAVDPVRMVLGDCSTVRLGGAQECLGVAEGIETAICASKAFSVPVWSALNANGLKTWEPPPGVKAVMVFGDNDPNFTGQEAAYVLAHRLALKGISVEVHIPTRVGTDWADTFHPSVA